MDRGTSNLTDSRERFYEAYWTRAAGPIPANDPTTSERQLMLEQALAEFLSRPRQGPQISKVLDAGCGGGEFSQFIQACGFEVMGIDTARAAVEIAQARCPNGRFHIGSLVERLPFCDAEFDAIWCTEVLEHIFDVHACLSEFNRVLHVGGILILTVPFHGLVKNLVIAIAGFERHFDPSLSHIRFFTKQSLKDSLNRAGFEALRWRGIGRVWPLYKSFFVVSRKAKASGPAPEIIG
jgi:2-polyprenyl-3-methyl-5-hydroxy-6-metoxy-1,4-benzoquinol methylase